MQGLGPFLIGSFALAVWVFGRLLRKQFRLPKEAPPRLVADVDRAVLATLGAIGVTIVLRIPGSSFLDRTALQKLDLVLALVLVCVSFLATLMAALASVDAEMTGDEVTIGPVPDTELSRRFARVAIDAALRKLKEEDPRRDLVKQADALLSDSDGLSKDELKSRWQELVVGLMRLQRARK